VEIVVFVIIEKRLRFPFRGHFEHEILIVLIVLERKVESANNDLNFTKILNDERIDKIVSFKEDYCVVNDLLKFERVLSRMFLLTLPHEFYKLIQVASDKGSVVNYWVLHFVIMNLSMLF
jgi:hypothetical protein